MLFVCTFFFFLFLCLIQAFDDVCGCLAFLLKCNSVPVCYSASPSKRFDCDMLELRYDGLKLKMPQTCAFSRRQKRREYPSNILCTRITRFKTTTIFFYFIYFISVCRLFHFPPSQPLKTLALHQFR